MAKTKRHSPIQPKSAISPLMIGLVVAAAVLIVGGLVLVNSMGKVTSELDLYPTMGSADAPVTMIEYSDYGCGHCRNFVLDTFDLIKKDYIDTGKVKYISHPFYLGNPTMGIATEAAWCANDQGKFFEYQHILQENQGEIDYSIESLTKLAGEIGLDETTFSECASNRTHQADVERARQAASNRGINSTPTFFINDRRVEGNYPYETFKQMIDQEIANAQ